MSLDGFSDRKRSQLLADVRKEHVQKGIRTDKKFLQDLQ